MQSEMHSKRLFVGSMLGPQRAPRELPRSFLKTKMELGETQKSTPEALKSLENDLKIRNSDVYETSEKT